MKIVTSGSLNTQSVLVWLGSVCRLAWDPPCPLHPQRSVRQAVCWERGGELLQQAILVFWFRFTLVMPASRYKKHLIPDFLLLAPGL